jgi:hypothetical protein
LDEILQIVAENTVGLQSESMLYHSKKEQILLPGQNPSGGVTISMSSPFYYQK